MQHDKIENKIASQFDAKSHIFPNEVSFSDCRVKALLDFLGDIRGKKILDAGCGKGRFSKILRTKGAVATGLDLSDKLLAEAKALYKDIEFVKGSVSKIPFSDNSFDCVFCIEVLEHLPNTQKAIEEMIRVCKKSGKIIIIEKNKLSLNRKFFMPNIIFKKTMEELGKWFYPRNFGFKEKWFLMSDFKKIFKKHCSKSEGGYLKDSENKIFSIFPFFNLFLFYRGTKQ